MTQVFARYAKDMLEKQTYPEVRRAPDVAARAALRRHAPGRSACCSASTSTFVNDAAARRLQADEASTGAPKLAGRRHRQRPALRVRLRGPGHRDRDQPLLKDGARRRVRRPVAGVGRRRRARGRIETARAKSSDAATAHGLRHEPRPPTAPTERSRAAPFARRASACTQPWTGGNMDEGWTRWVLEQYEFNLTDAPQRRRPRRQAARSKFDAIILPDQSAARDHRRLRRRRRSGRNTAAASATRASTR